MAWTQRLPSGNWRGLYRIPGGKTQSAGTFPYERRALAEAMRKEEDASLPGWRDPRAAGQTWGAWYEKWWPAHVVAESSTAADASAIKNHIMPYWGKVSLADITRFAVKEWAAHLGRAKDQGGAGLAESSVIRYMRTFSSSLSAAVDAEIIKVNPTFRLGLEPGETDIMRFFTRKQVSKMLKKLEGRPEDRAMLSVLVGCGLRWGEMAGLRSAQIDLKRGMLRVTHTRTQRGTMKKYPKGKRIRDVPVPGWVCQELKPYVKMQREYVFMRTNSSNWRRDVWKGLNAGGRIHDLRHTYASWLLQDGLDMAEVAKLMGHSSTRVTERYAHIALVPSAKVMAALTDPRVSKRVAA